MHACAKQLTTTNQLSSTYIGEFFITLHKIFKGGLRHYNNSKIYPAWRETLPGNIRVRLPRKMCFKFTTKVCQ